MRVMFAVCGWISDDLMFTTRCGVQIAAWFRGCVLLSAATLSLQGRFLS